MKIVELIKEPFSKKSNYNNKISFLLLLTFVNIFMNAIVIIILLDTNKTESEKIIEQFNILEQFIFIGIIFPLIEEVVFRYPLKLNSKSIDVLFLVTFPFLIILIFNPNLLVIGMFIFITISFYYSFKKQIKNYLIKGSANIFTFYGLALLFSLSHIDNYYTSTPIFNIIIYTIITFIAGILYNTIRLQLGLKYAIWSHIIYNCFFITLNFLHPI